MEAYTDEKQKVENEIVMTGKNLAEKAIGTVKSTARELASNSDGVAAGERGEGAITKRIENATSKIPSATFLSLAIASIGVSAILQMCGRKSDAQFVGQWVPTILTLGLYNKLVKLQGSE